MLGKMSRALVLVLAISLVATGVAFAQEDTTEVRFSVAGEVTGVDLSNQFFTLRTRGGESLRVWVTERTYYRGRGTSVNGLEDIRPGMLAAASGLRGEDGKLIAYLVVAGEKDDILPETIRVFGEITNIIPGQNTFTLKKRNGAEVTFLVNDRTRYRSRDGSVEDIHDLKKGMIALVVAVEQGDGILLARMVAAGTKDDLPDNRFKVQGEIAGVDEAGSNFTLQTKEGRTLLLMVTDRTRFASRDGSVQGLEDLEVGMLAIVVGLKGEDGSLVALGVGVRTKLDPANRFSFTGEITQVDMSNGTFGLTPKNGQEVTIQVTERTRFKSRDGSIQGLEDLRVGMVALAAGIKTEEGSYPALLVVAGEKGDLPWNRVRVFGEISQVIPGQNTFAVESRKGEEVSFLVTERTKFRSQDGSVEDIHDLKKGMLSLVVAVRHEGGDLEALVVMVTQPGNHPPGQGADVWLGGRIVLIGDHSFTLQTNRGREVVISVDGSTSYRSWNGTVDGFEDLEVGMSAVVGARTIGADQLKGVWVLARAPRSETD